MGNWRTVAIIGTCAHAEVAGLRSLLRGEMDHGPLHIWGASLYGIDDWVGAEMFKVGNLFERDYSVDDVAAHLRRLLPVAPSLRLKVHCGGEHEDKTCVATIDVTAGTVTVGPPEEAQIPELDTEQLQERMLAAVLHARRI